mmetsp:Transcript_1360/g.3157  ORF Transcript_1360/g.3157 Transcript_1360/m.3157 type:complete len:128 (+) Transcript_1360:1-384(+)
MGVVSYRCPVNRSVDFLDWYQEWAIEEGHKMSPNIEIVDNEKLLVEGMFRGNLTEFYEMLRETQRDHTSQSVGLQVGRHRPVCRGGGLHSCSNAAEWLGTSHRPARELVAKVPSVQALLQVQVLVSL